MAAVTESSPAGTEPAAVQPMPERQKLEALEIAVAAFGVAMIAVDREGRVCYATPAAQVLLTLGRGLKVENGELLASNTADNPVLRRALEQVGGTAAANGKTHAPRGVHSNGHRRPDMSMSRYVEALCLQRPEPMGPLHISMVPAPAGMGGSRSAAALLFVQDGGHTPPSRGGLLRMLYRITPTQARLADLLLTGLSVRESAETMSIAEDTARFHLKSIFRITGTKNQADLLRMMMSLPGDAGGRPAMELERN